MEMGYSISVEGRWRLTPVVLTEGCRTADFGPDDFESWWLSGRDRTDPLSRADRKALEDAMLYIAHSEQRVMAHSRQELRERIEAWARRWNIACVEVDA